MLQEIVKYKRGIEMRVGSGKMKLKPRVPFSVADHPEAQALAMMFTKTNCYKPCRFCLMDTRTGGNETKGARRMWSEMQVTRIPSPKCFRVDMSNKHLASTSARPVCM